MNNTFATSGLLHYIEYDSGRCVLDWSCSQIYRDLQQRISTFLSPQPNKVSLSGLTTGYFSLIPDLIIMIQAMGFFFSGITEESQMPRSLISS